jgi:hypothetical protein
MMKKETDHQINEKRMTLWTKRLGIFTFILAITSIFTAYILYKTDQTSRLRDRAYLYFGDPYPIPWPPNKPDVLGIGIIITNNGNMPAKHVLVRYACPYTEKARDIKDPFPLIEWNIAEAPITIGAKQSFVLQGCNIPIGIIENAKKSLTDVFYIAEVKYSDGFSDEVRTTQTSRIFRFDKSGQSIGMAGPHNCSDEDCQK